MSGSPLSLSTMESLVQLRTSRAPGSRIEGAALVRLGTKLHQVIELLELLAHSWR